MNYLTRIALCMTLSLSICATTFAKNDSLADAEREYADGNFAAAQAKFKSLSLRGNAAAHYFLGRMYFRGEGVKESKSLAIQHIRKSAVASHAPAQDLYAWMMFSGYASPKNVKESFEWYEKAAQQGYLPSILFLAKAYEYGVEGWPSEKCKAHMWYGKAAELGHAESKLIQEKLATECGSRTSEESKKPASK